MNVYPEATLRHFAPLVLISGLAIPEPLDETSQARVWTLNAAKLAESHPCEEQGEQLATSPRLRDPGDEDVIMPELFYKFSQKSIDIVTWNPDSLNIARRRASHFLNIQFLSNDEPEYLLPPVKTKRTDLSGTPNLQQREYDDSASIMSRQSTVDPSKYQYASGSAHSPLSPLTASSELYPDGIISEKWIQKYLYIVPSTFVSIYLLKTNSETKQEEQEADERLARKINTLKSQLSLRDIRLIVIVVSEVLPSVDLSLNDRIYYLRKNTGLAPRAGLFFLPPSTEIELETLVETVCQISFSHSLDFFSNIAKKVRKKRGGRPKTLNMTPEEAALMTTSPLSNAGWETRYNFKLGALAELRQEIESSTKAYEVTYEMALELFETLHPLTETSAKRWCEFRVFLDTLAFRIVKLRFYSGTPNLAYKKFLNHLFGVSSILDSRGFSRDGFSFKNWRATQYFTLASLVDETNGSLFSGSSSIAPNSDEQEPGDCLPRSGFLHLAAVHTFFDLLNGSYQEGGTLTDPYLDQNSTDLQVISTTIKQSLQAAASDFSVGDHPNERSVGYAMYLLGETCFLHDKDVKAAQEYYKEAAVIYRKDRWNSLLQIVLERLLETSQAVEDYEESVLTQIELDLCSPPAATAEPKLESLISKLNLDESQTVDITDKERHLSLYNAEYTFATKECFLGLPIRAQLVLTSIYPPDILPSSSLNYIIDELCISISGELASVHVVNNETLPANTSGLVVLTDLFLEDESVDFASRVFKAEANLSFAPGQKIVIEFVQIPKRLGEARFSELTMVARHADNFRLSMKIPMTPNMSGAVQWYNQFGDGAALTKRIIRIPNPYRTKLSPRPSLVKVALDVKGPVALGERLIAQALVSNSEPEEIVLELQAKGMTNKGDAVNAHWVAASAEVNEGANTNETNEPNESKDLLQGLRIPAGGSLSIPLEIQIPTGSINSVSLEFFVSYYSANDEETLIKDGMVIVLTTSKPFIVNFDVHPRIHSAPWPNFFVPTSFSPSDDSGEFEFGITPSIWKKWELCASVLCLSEGEGTVEVLGSQLDFETLPGTSCKIVEKPSSVKHGEFFVVFSELNDYLLTINSYET